MLDRSLPAAEGALRASAAYAARSGGAALVAFVQAHGPWSSGSTPPLTRRAGRRAATTPWRRAAGGRRRPTTSSTPTRRVRDEAPAHLRRRLRQVHVGALRRRRAGAALACQVKSYASAFVARCRATARAPRGRARWITMPSSLGQRGDGAGSDRAESGRAAARSSSYAGAARPSLIGTDVEADQAAAGTRRRPRSPRGRLAEAVGGVAVLGLYGSASCAIIECFAGAGARVLRRVVVLCGDLVQRAVGRPPSRVRMPHAVAHPRAPLAKVDRR